MKREKTEFAEAYIRANDVTGDDSFFWANEDLMECVWEEPEYSWPIILEIISRDPPIWVLAILAAGPLEDLLRAHGPLFIDRVEHEAARNESFRDVLSHVYPHACQPEIADRIRRAVAGE